MHALLVGHGGREAVVCVPSGSKIAFGGTRRLPIGVTASVVAILVGDGAVDVSPSLLAVFPNSLTIVIATS